MISLRSVMTGFSPVFAMSCHCPEGDAPYSTMPGRTQSKCASGCQRVAAELASERGQSSPSAACSIRRIGSTIPCGFSASAKCDISVISPTLLIARSCCQTVCTRSGIKPSRFIPLFTLR